MNKFFLKSKTIIGVLVSVLPSLLPAVGVTVSADEAQLVSGDIDALIQAVGVLLAIYGRFVAIAKLKFKKEKSID